MHVKEECGGKVFYKTGNYLGGRSSASGLCNLFFFTIACENVCECVCMNSFLIMYYHSCECVLFSRLFCPFIEGVLSEARSNNCCCGGEYVSVEHNLNTQWDCVHYLKLLVQRDLSPICIYICIKRTSGSLSTF